MTKWEYIIIAVSIDSTPLNTMGAKGWELVALYNGFGYFKRAKATRARAKK